MPVNQPAQRQRLFLIDGYSNIFRAFYAIRHLSNSKGEPTNAVYGFVQMLRKLLRDENPDLVGVALDVSGETVRSERYEEYKANRAPMPEELRPQIPWIRRALDAFNIPILELERYEADDVLGTLAQRAAAAGYEVVLVSADKDLMQLVDDHVKLFHTGRGKLYDPALVEEDLGVPPSKVVDIMALKGDSVDNVPGVPGIGEKGAVQLIREFGSLAELLERSEEVKRKSYRTGLTEHRDLAELSQELVTIHTDLPIEFEPVSLEHEPPDAEALRELYREMEFSTLLKELEAGGPAAEIVPAREVMSAEEWQAAVAEVGERVFVAPVGGDAGGGGPTIGLAAGGAEGAAIFADFRRPSLEAAALGSLADWLADPARELAGHDMKETIRLAPPGTPVACRLFDTMLVSYLLRSALRAHTLEEVALDRLGHKALGAGEVGWVDGQEPPAGSDALLAFAGERVELPRRLAGPLAAELGDGPLAALYEEIEAPLVPVLVAMEEAGVLLDTAFLARMSAELGQELAALEASIWEEAGEEFNINSSKQLGEILFEKLDYPAGRKTRKTKSYSTDSDTLQWLAIQGYTLADSLLRFRELRKLKSTYVDALPALVGADGRLHTRFHQAVAATGRLSSANPNLQNIPVRTDLGQQIRRAFTAPPGRRLVVADYNQIELRILAHIAREEAMIEAFAAGADIHRTTAASVFGSAADLVTAEQRRAAKAINFGIIYGISAFGLARNLGIPQGDAKEIIDAYLAQYPAVNDYMQETVAAAEATGKVETLYGRVRWLPELQSRNRARRENAGRMAINARIQGTAADLQKLAMIAVDRRLRRDYPESALLLTVHDELVLEAPAADVDRLAAALKEEMEGVADLAVPLVVDVGSGQDWYEAKV